MEEKSKKNNRILNEEVDKMDSKKALALTHNMINKATTMEWSTKKVHKRLDEIWKESVE